MVSEPGTGEDTGRGPEGAGRVGEGPEPPDEPPENWKRAEADMSPSGQKAVTLTVRF
jgi:hypothetical protein